MFFDQDSAELTASDRAALDNYAQAYVAASSAEQVTVDGFASAEGDAAHNNQVSDQRAEAVSAYLASKGIPATKIKARSFGSTDQFSASDPRANRRTTLTPRSPSGVGPTASPPAAPPLQLTHQTEVSSPSNRQRTTIGVGERVTLSVNPGPGAWLISGTGKLSKGRGSTVTLIAGDTAGTVDISVNVAGQTGSLRFQVIAPSAITMEIRSRSHAPASGPNGIIVLSVFIGPASVSFANIAVREVDRPPRVADGIFAGVTTHHPTATPTGCTTTVASGKGTLLRFPDNAGLQPVGAPVAAGQVIFDIPWVYNVNGGTEHPLTTVVQSVISDAVGTLTVSKDGVSESFPI